MEKSHFRLGLVLGLVLANGALGCEAQDCDNPDTGAEGVCLKSLKRFEADQADSTAYPGGDIIIDSSNGDVHVMEGASGEVSVSFESFVYLAFDSPQERADEELLLVENALSTNGNDVHIDVTRLDGAMSTLGADIMAMIPPEFAGNLRIDQSNGDTTVDFAGGAMGVLVTSDNGGCDVATGAASEISVHCDNGDLSASIADVTAQSGSGFSTGNGSITLDLPGDAVFSVQAAALAGGTVTADNLPSGCVLAAASESAKTLSCNGATTENPVYQVKADGTSLADVVLRF